MGANGRRCWWCCCCCGGSGGDCSARKLLYIAGLLVLLVGIICCLVGCFNTSWVYREGGSTQTASTVDHYGLWTACSPDYFDTCNHVFDAMPNVEGGARGSQALITLALIFYISCSVLEIVSCCPFGLKRKLSTIFDNRVIEYAISVAAVAGFLGMLIFAGEVKNKAARNIGQVDYTGSGFCWALSGHLLVVIGGCLLACGRDVKTSDRTRM